MSHWNKLIVGLLCLSATLAEARVDIIKSPGQTTYQITVDPISFNDATAGEKNFSEMKLSGVDGFEGILYVEGSPEIPVVRLIVDGESSTVSVGGVQKMALPKSNVLVKPVQASVRKTPGAKSVFAFNSKAYRTNAFWPAKDFTVEEAGTVRGKRRLMITLHPVAYNPVTGELRFRDYFEVTVTNTAAEKTAPGNLKSGLALVVGQQFANSPSLQRYISFKQESGFTTEMILFGRDAHNPQEIRAALQRIYSQSNMKLENVLIVGDAADVPGFSSSLISGTTDHYYASLDNADYMADLQSPDAGVGRFSASNETELAAMVDKSIAYARGLFRQENWLNSVSFMATNDRWQLAEATHNYVIETHTSHLGYVGIFPNPNQAGGDRLYAVTHQVPNTVVQQAMREGRTIIDYSGHGAQTFWDAPRVTQADVRALSDDSSLPFVISNACITGDFRIPESFAETWNRHRYGAIMFWGSMDSTYWDEDDILERRMFDGIYTLNKKTFGEITLYSLTEHARHYGGQGRSSYYWETYHMFGDPSLELRTTRTKAARIEGPTEVPVGLSQLEYMVRDEAGQPLADAMVSVFLKNGNWLDSRRSAPDGTVVFSPSPSVLVPGEQIRLVVTGQNLRESTFETQVISPDTAFLNLNKIHLNGRDLAIAGAGELLQVEVTIANVGLVATSGAELRVEGVTGPAEFQGSPMQVSSMGSGDQITLMLAGSLRIFPSAQRGETVRLNFSWTTREGAQGRFVKNIEVARGGVEVTGVDFGSTLSGSEGGIRPGSAGTIFVTLRNNGNEAIQNLMLSMKPDACLSFAQGDVLLPALEVGAATRVEIGMNVAVDAACRSGDQARFRLEGAYQGLGGSLALSTIGQFTVGVLAMKDFAAANIGLAIPDNGPEVEFSMPINGSGVVSDIGVTIGITHTYISDLVVQLVHPSGAVAVLHNNDGGSSANLNETYGMGGNQNAELKKLFGLPSQGIWKLRIKDSAGADTGTLDSVKLSLMGYIE